MEKMITKRVAVVTGGGSGMGEATCHELARRGHSVAVLDVDEEAGFITGQVLGVNGGAVM
ncbi:Uncharacterised protein [Mycolicibacterium vanbaalenii]|uniref:Uncharacterized protein n=1 Tax=Mycolicibacterium vanbaalenii TaxID=110539 RepID=A0A5S9R4I4_MYCVN|nr:Uncharacterised protein [Mycolicibacterium vanbaalenii]